MQLVRFEAARSALAECQRIDEVKDIRDKAEAMAAYARQARDSELIQFATEIKVRAERKCGEMLAATDMNKGAAVAGTQRGMTRSNDATASPTLADMGITKDQSSRYQLLASMPADAFEAAIETAKEVVGEVTTAFMLRETRERVRPAVMPRLTAAAMEKLELAGLRLFLADMQKLTGQQDAPDIVEFVGNLMGASHAN